MRSLLTPGPPPPGKGTVDDLELEPLDLVDEGEALDRLDEGQALEMTSPVSGELLPAEEAATVAGGPRYAVLPDGVVQIGASLDVGQESRVESQRSDRVSEGSSDPKANDSVATGAEYVASAGGPAASPDGLSITRLPTGGVRIEAPAALAVPLAELLESLARSLRAGPAGPAVDSPRPALRPDRLVPERSGLTPPRQECQGAAIG